MAKSHVKKGDEIIVIAGSAKGRRGTVTKVLPAKEFVIVEGNDERSKTQEDRARLVKPVLHYLRKSQQNPQGGVLWLEGPVHISNVMKADEFDRRRTKKTSKS
jgi:large subunit ribosomal protein L24